jgi:basic amino acid/polyamine antiporter, APA family
LKEKQFNNQTMLKREIGIIGLAANMVNIIIGAGIFTLPIRVASILGEASVLAYLVCGFLMFTIILCFAEIGSQNTDSGGSFAYIYEAFGDYAGFIANVMFWFGTGVLMNAALVNIMADMLQIQGLGLRILFFLVLFSCLVFINIRGVKYGNRFVIFNTIIKLLPLILLILFGFMNISSENLAWKSTPTLSNIGSASLLLFFAFGGGESALSVSGEIKNPSRSIPIGILLGLALVLVIYILIQVISQGVLGNEMTQYASAPLGEVANRVFGKFGYLLITFGGIYAIFGNLSGSILAYPRVIFAGAEKGWFPRFLATIHPKFATPYIAIIIYAILVFGFAISGQFDTLIIITSASLLLVYLGVVLAVIKLRFSNKNQEKQGFKLPFGLLIPIIAVFSILFFLMNLSQKEIIGFVIAIVILSVIYLLIKALKKV